MGKYNWFIDIVLELPTGSYYFKEEGIKYKLISGLSGVHSFRIK